MSNIMPRPRTLILATLALSVLASGCARQPQYDPSQYDQRSSDVAAIDDTVERETTRALNRADGRLAQARIRPHSFNGAVLLVGQVPSQELKRMAADVTASLKGVDEVHNELDIAARLSNSQRVTDSWLTSNVSSRLALDATIDASKLKVTTENSTVYLMGIVSRREADRIVASAANAAGVEEIVKVFDYLD